jgi:hypothetical protein
MFAALLTSARPRPLRVGFTVLSLTMLLAAGLSSTASAGPQAATNCTGALTKSPTADEPNQLTYSFFCDGDINSYSLVANRAIKDSELIDNFSTTADVYYNPLAPYAPPAIVPTEGFGCEGPIPGNGINCSTAASGKPGATAYHTVVGRFDMTDPVCGGTPTDAPKNSTTILPRAWVDLIVNDASTANDGPFRVNLAFKCPKIKPVTKPQKRKCKVIKGKLKCTTVGPHKGGKKGKSK